MTAVEFADRFGSTGIFERMGADTASRVVTVVANALTTTFEAHRGRMVKLPGDGLFVVFLVQSPHEGDADATVMGGSMPARQATRHGLSRMPGARELSMTAGGNPLSIGCGRISPGGDAANDGGPAANSRVSAAG